MALLPKGGLDVAGHKIPWEAIAALAGVAGVILVIRARQQGQSVSAGSAPSSAIDPSLLGSGTTAPDYSAALANISQQLTSLQQSGINGPATPAAGSVGQSLTSPANAPAVINPPPSFGQVTADIGGGFIHSAPNPAASVLGFFSGSPLNISGAPVTGASYSGSTSPGLIGIASDQWIPVSYGGGTGYIWAPEAHINA